MTDCDWLIDWVGEYSGWIFWPLLLGYVVLAPQQESPRAGRRLPRELRQIVVFNALVLPLFACLTLYCYHHPERIADPIDDLRNFWKAAAGCDACLTVYFLFLAWRNERRRRWAARMDELLDEGNRLLAAGQIDDGIAAYRRRQWIRDTKLGTKS